MKLITSIFSEHKYKKKIPKKPDNVEISMAIDIPTSESSISERVREGERERERERESYVK